MTVASHVLLDLGDGKPGVESLGARLGAVHDCVTSIHRERVPQHILALLCKGTDQHEYK